jgi:arylsulfatase A-like enzyme
VAAGCCAAAGCGPPAPPNVVLVSIDTLRPQALRSYAPEAPPLPAFDALAAESARFETALSTAGWTLPAHGSLLTGLYPDRHGATDQRVALAPDAPRLAEGLRAAGYETAAFAGGGYVGVDYGFHEGFGFWEGPTAGEPLERAAAWVEAREARAAPFFLFVHTFGVHNYFRARPPAAALAPGSAALAPRDALACLLGRTSCPADVFQRLEGLYAAEVALLDASLARLLRALERDGLRGRTLVTLVSDHGEGFDGARARIHHGGRLHADQLRIPLLLRVPGLPARVVTQPVSLVDVAPTLLELGGAPVPADLDGRSLAPLLRGQDGWPERPLFAMDHYHAWRGGRRLDSPSVQPRPLSLAVVTDRLWYLTGPNGEELYATAGDPEQRRNLLDASRAGPRARLERLRAAAGSRLRDRPATPRVDLDSELEGELRSLGYVE